MTEDLFADLPAEAVELYMQAVETGYIHMTPPADSAGPLAFAARLDHRQRLVDLGLLQPGMERPVLVPVDPEIAAAQQERRIAADLARAVGLRDRWQTLTTAYRAARAWHDESSLVRYVEGKEAIGQELQLVLSGQIKRVRTIQPGGPRPPELIKAAIADELGYRRRGIQRQILYQDPQRHHAPTAHFVRAVTEAGVEVRTLPYLPDRAFLIDDLVMYPLNGDNDVAVFNREPSVVAILNRLFEQNWERAAPFTERPEASRGQQLSPEQRRIVHLLVGGMTTEAIATTLAMSVRTVARHLERARHVFTADSLAELAWKIRGEYPSGLPADW